jgi:hypothetical protein
MIPVRKLTFQLTPLLDLLLIVIFAQYLEVRTVAREEVARMRAEQDELRGEYHDAVAQLENLTQRLAGLDELKQERRALSLEVRRMKAQRDLVGEMVVELFRMPESAVDAIVKDRTSLGPGPNAAEIGRLKEQIQKIADDRGDEIVEHLMTFNELRKRCDLWELYLQGDGQIVFTTGEKRQILRAEDLDAFAARLFDAYKALPQPKSLVLVLVSYGDARLGVRQAVLDGLPAALERIRIDDEGRSRFDYAVLGYRPERPPGDAP